ALGLFRRVSITELTHEYGPRRDALVQVEEAPPTSISYGGGLEGGTRLRPTGPGGEAQERIEYAPRGSFEITRSNLWGKNRSVDLFTRASLKSRDIVVGNTVVSSTQTTTKIGRASCREREEGQEGAGGGEQQRGRSKQREAN